MKKLLFAMLFVGTFCANAQVVSYATEFTRPANATAYTAGDVVTGTDSLPRLLIPASAYNSGRIVAAILEVDTASTTDSSFTLFYYSDSLGLGKIADNAANAATFSSDSLLLGRTDFVIGTSGTASGSVSRSYVRGSDNVVPFYQTRRWVSGVLTSTGIWGRLVATDAYVPKNGGKIRIVLFVEEARR